MRRIAIVDYGMGNVDSVGNALTLLGASHLVAGRPEDLVDAHAIVLPGVGAFAAAMENLRARGWVEALEEQVRVKGKPYLGICLGMQLVAEDSTEGTSARGLGWFEGAHVVAMPTGPDVRLPHVGWNTIAKVRPSPLLEAADAESHFYYDHGYQLVCDELWVTSRSTYGAPFVASVERDNVLGVQFHPEKSQRNGLKMLRRFLQLIEVA